MDEPYKNPTEKKQAEEIYENVFTFSWDEPPSINSENIIFGQPMDVNPLDPTGIRDSTKGYSTPVRLKHDQYGKFLLFVMGKNRCFLGF